jgi:divalent metal cation (Fe/Co/Zn/Cd) transporter
LGVALSQATGNPFWDGAASVVIGLILGVTAWVLAVESKALLIGEAADPALVDSIRTAAAGEQGIVGVGHIMTVHSSPDQITVVMSADFEDAITAGEVERIIARIEAKVEQHWPAVKRLYIRPQQDAARLCEAIEARAD